MFCYIAQAGLELSSCLSLPRVGITSVGRHVWLIAGDFYMEKTENDRTSKIEKE
jgi:hypothetical protein